MFTSLHVCQKRKFQIVTSYFFFHFLGNQKPDECEMKSNFEHDKEAPVMEVSDGFDKPQPSIKLLKVVQNDQKYMKGSEDSKDQTIETSAKENDRSKLKRKKKIPARYCETEQMEIEKIVRKTAKNIVCSTFPDIEKKIDTLKGSDQSNETKPTPNNNDNFANNLNESNCEEIQTEVDLGVKKSLELAEASQQISIKVKKFECKICSKKFRCKDNQQLHMKSHKNKENNDSQNKNLESVKKSAGKHVSQGVPGFTCPSLGKTFNVRELINKLKTCEVCAKKFDTKKLLKDHMKLHDINGKQDVDSSKETEVDLSKETEVDLSKEKEVTLSKEKEVFLSKEKEVDSFQKKRNLKRHIGEVHEGKKPLKFREKLKNTLDKRINDQPPTKLQKVVQNDQTSMKGSEDSKDQTIETQLPEDKKHVSEAHFVEKKKIDQKSMTSSPNEDETPNAGMIAQT